MRRYILFPGSLCGTVAAAIFVAYWMGIISVQGTHEAVATGTQKLRSLAYVNEVEIPQQQLELSGVTTLVEGKIADGVNIYTPSGGDSAQLIDALGNVLHLLRDQRQCPHVGWNHVKPYRNGHFLVVAEGSQSPLFMIDWDSNVIWESKLDCHHDVSFDADGNIYALCRQNIDAPEISTHKILDERLIVFSPDGQVIQEVSFAEIFAKDSVMMEIIRSKNNQEFGDSGRVQWDVFHMNTVEVFRDRPAGSAWHGAFRPGNVLFCSRSLDLIGVVDLVDKRVVWHWGPGELQGPHVPTLLPNGHVLVLDNGSRRGRSRIVEMDPLNYRIVSTIGDDQRSAFFTSISGGVQRLPNGNTLIAESQNGRVFEVAPDGELVWEFYTNPWSQDGKWMRRVVFRMPRIVDFEEFPELRAMQRGVPAAG